MNFNIFNRMCEKSEYDEIKVIGKDIIHDGKPYHLIGMTRKNKEVTIYGLEIHENATESNFAEVRHDVQTPRESMKESINKRYNGMMYRRSRKCALQIKRTENVCYSM